MKILITGISGQDGVFLTRLINKKHVNFRIIGTSRNISKKDFIQIAKQDIQNLEIVNLELTNFKKVNKLIKDYEPDIVFNLSGPSSVYESILNSNIENEIVTIFENLTKSLIENNNFCKFFQASSSEMYGLNNEEKIYSEKSLFLPNSPYAKGKLDNHKKVKELKEKYNWEIFSGIMFNHESEFRNADYLFMKIINTAMEIKNRSKKHLTIGSLNIVRDWSYAEDIVEGVYEIVMNGKSYDYILGSGIGTSINQVVDIIFTYFELDYKKFTKIDTSILRKNDPEIIISNPHKTEKEIGWTTSKKIEDFLPLIIDKHLALNN